MIVTNARLLRELQTIEQKLDVLMSQNDEVLGDVATLQATAATIQNGVTTALGHITDLEGQIAAGQPIDPATLAALKQAVTDVGAAGQGVAGLATA